MSHTIYSKTDLDTNRVCWPSGTFFAKVTLVPKIILKHFQSKIVWRTRKILRGKHGPHRSPENFLKIVSYPLRWAWPFIWTNLNPLHPRMLYAKFGWNGPSGSEEEVENVKSLQTDRQMDKPMDNRRSEKLTWAFSSGELKSKQTSIQTSQIHLSFWQVPSHSWHCGP